MKKTVLFVVAMMAVLSVAGQSFARGGGMSGGMSGGMGQAGFSGQSSPMTTETGMGMSGMHTEMHTGMQQGTMQMPAAASPGSQGETAGSTASAASNQGTATTTTPQTVTTN
ncbi:hypothetical protein L4X63_18515 [Geomonas sp. Red32]|uniref:hypothetical protein n=1 Tax=Geomonas sp. Red32 TaxID=2912856 RepID=UPI00202CB67B|nr:hypothetical protein [Geomonas sp. Red32]MCM0083583.1 hypothetical protein [Geomonas sp. Red32]